MPDEPRIVRAPFTPEQVASLNAYQASNLFHPYTCLTSSHGPLIATEAGWHCSVCDYKQNHAHAFVANAGWGKIKKPRPASEETTP
jgi:hypothetical protein